MKKWEEDLYMFHCATAPTERKSLQEYIELYLTEKDERYFNFFLHFYEPRLNDKIYGIVHNYAMQGHFADLKMVFVHGLYKALDRYDLSQNVPFLYFAKYYYEHEIHEYIRSMRHGLTIPNADEDKMLRKAMALYREYGEIASQENIEKIAEQIDRSPKFTCELIVAGLRNTLFIPFYKEYCDEDSEETAEDVTSDNTFNPELELIRKEQSEAVWAAYNDLDIGTQMMIADNLAFCHECHSIFEMQKDKNGEPVKVRRKKKTYKEIATLNEMSEEESVRHALQKGYEEMRGKLFLVPTLQNLKIPSIENHASNLYNIISTKTGGETMKAKILIVEDDIYLREGLCELLLKEDYEPVSACNCKEGRKLFTEDSFDLVILDVMLPDGNGLDLCSFIRSTGADVPILFLTACDEEFQIVRGLDAGADDYVTKPFRLLELLSRIRALLRRKTATTTYQFGDIIVDISKMTVKKDGETLFLTPTEFQIISALIQNNGVIVTRASLLQRIWDSDGNFIDDNTLSVHISRLRDKIGTEHIATVRGTGYRWEE